MISLTPRTYPKSNTIRPEAVKHKGCCIICRESWWICKNSMRLMRELCTSNSHETFLFCDFVFSIHTEQL